MVSDRGHPANFEIMSQNMSRAPWHELQPAMTKGSGEVQKPTQNAVF